MIIETLIFRTEDVPTIIRDKWELVHGTDKDPCDLAICQSAYKGYMKRCLLTVFLICLSTIAYAIFNWPVDQIGKFTRDWYLLTASMALAVAFLYLALEWLFFMPLKARLFKRFVKEYNSLMLRLGRWEFFKVCNVSDARDSNAYKDLAEFIHFMLDSCACKIMAIGDDPKPSQVSELATLKSDFERAKDTLKPFDLVPHYHKAQDLEEPRGCAGSAPAT